MTRVEVILFSTISGILGLLFIAIPSFTLAYIYFPIVALSFILMGITKILFSNLNTKDEESILNFIEGLLAIIIGVVYLNFYRNIYVDIISFILLSIIPIIRLFKAKRLSNQLLFDSLKYVGLISLLGGYIHIHQIFFILCSIFWFALYFYIIINYLYKRKESFKYEED